MAQQEKDKEKAEIPTILTSPKHFDSKAHSSASSPRVKPVALPSLPAKSSTVSGLALRNSMLKI